MYNTNLLPEKLMAFEYYQNKLPLYLQNSHGFISHFKLWYDMAIGEDDYTGLLTSGNGVLYLLNIFDSNYLTELAKLPGYTSTSCDILDKLAKLFCVQRVFTIPGDSTVELTNEELLLLIKAKIIQNYYDGTREQLMQYYKDAGLRVFAVTDQDMFSPACKVILCQIGSEYSANTIAMFEAGLLFVQSMGINYSFETQTLSVTMTWDTGLRPQWDVGEWDT